MALFVKRGFELYNHTFYDTDPRVVSYPLISSPIPLLFILITYQLFVQKIGPAFMKHRKPYKLDHLIQVYNAFQVFTCLILVIMASPGMILLDWRCSEIDFSSSDTLLVRLGYAYFILKLVDLLDTVFFVLRKKMNQVTFLHVYHHTGMTIITWFVFKHHAGGHSCYMAYINSAVHVVMYSYYFISNYNQKYKKSLWWKKYITQVQLVQFVVCSFLYVQPMIRRDCKFSYFVSLLAVTQNLYMFVLFSKFYYKAYIKKIK